MGFPRQEYEGGLPFPSPGDLSNPEIEPASPAFTRGFFTTEPPGKPITANHTHWQNAEICLSVTENEIKGS